MRRRGTSDARPPRLARWLVRLTARPDDRRFVLGDLDGEFVRIAAAETDRAAARWYWRQAIMSAGPLLRERLAGSRSWPSPSGLIEDAKHGARWVRRHPWTSATVIATLAVAFGAGLAALAIAEVAVWHPLPYPAPAQLVRVWTTGPARPTAVRAVSRPDFMEWRERLRSFTALSAYAQVSFRMTERGEPREVDAVRVDRDLDRVMGAAPLLGRSFTEADFTPGGRHVVLLRHAFWTREFGGDPAVIGRTLSLDEERYLVVGVLPPSRAPLPLEPHDLWVPLVPRDSAFWETARSAGWLTVLGRLRPGVTRESAEAELTALAIALERAHPASNAGKSIGRAASLAAEIAGPVKPMLALLAAAIGAVILIACGNIGSLLLATLAGRDRELAIRAAIGAGRSRLIRQGFAENLILCALAAGGALLLAPAMTAAFVSLYPGGLAGVSVLGMTPLLLGACGGATVVTAGLLTLPQAARARRAGARGDLTLRMKPSRADRALGHALVTLQVALSFVLLVAGASLSRTVQRLNALDPGFRSDGVLTFTLAPSRQMLSTSAQTVAFYDALVRDLGTIPGVRSAAAAIAVPLTSTGHRFGLRSQGASSETLVNVNHAGPGYFETLGIRLREGRLMTGDEHRGARVVVINRPLAHALTGDTSAVGLRVPYSGQLWEVIGVVEGARTRQLREPAPPEIYLPWHLAGPRAQAIAVRTSGDPLGLVPAIAARVRALDPSLPLGRPGTLDSRLSEARRTEAFRAALVTALAAIAVALAALGAYSVTAYDVARRRREYGIRLALGERPRSIVRRALWNAVSPALQGTALGLAVAVLGSRWLGAFLFEVDPRDATTLAGAAASLLALSLAAVCRSSLKAAGTDAVNTLRLDT